MAHRTRLALAIVLALIPVGVVVAQPARGPVVGQLLPYLRDEKLQRELRLTPEQVKALVTHRQQLWDEQLNTPAAEFAAGAATRALATREEFRKTLTPEQHDRAAQLATRVALRPLDRRSIDPTRVEARNLVAFPEVAAALALTADQRAVGEASPFGGVVFLAPPQTAALEKLLGPPTEVAWEAEFDTRERANAEKKRTRFPVWSLTWSTDAHADLKLSAEQVKALDAIRTTTSTGPGGARLPIAEESARREEQAWQVLTPAQQVRLRQIDARQFSGFGNSDLFTPSLFNDLAMSAEQQRTILVARTAYADAIARAALSGDSGEAVARAVRAATETRDLGFRAALTPDQQAKFDVGFGEPFTGMVGLDPRVWESMRARRVSGFGRYSSELSVLTLNRAVQDELQLTPERLKLVREASSRAPRVPFPATDDAAEAKSEYVGKTLAALLTPGQQRRFRQLMLQECEQPSTTPVARFDAPAGVAYPGVADAVGLTDAQRARLIDGEVPLDVLTPRQQASIRAMLGEPFGGPFGTGVEFSRPRTPAPRGAVLTDLPWSAAALTPDQAATVARALNTFQMAVTRPAAAPRPPLGKGPPATLPSTPADVLEKAVTDAVTAGQVRRLDQLALQQAAGRDPRAVLTGFQARRLELTREQVEKLFEVEQDWRKVARAVLPARLTPDQRRDLFDRLRRRLDDQLHAALTPAQRAAWADLTGEPCPAVPRPMPMFRPPGL